MWTSKKIVETSQFIMLLLLLLLLLLLVVVVVVVVMVVVMGGRVFGGGGGGGVDLHLTPNERKFDPSYRQLLIGQWGWWISFVVQIILNNGWYIYINVHGIIWIAMYLYCNSLKHFHAMGNIYDIAGNKEKTMPLHQLVESQRKVSLTQISQTLGRFVGMYVWLYNGWVGMCGWQERVFFNL